eukprot:PhM_4_TR5163/c1_g1_i1/m.79832
MSSSSLRFVKMRPSTPKAATPTTATLTTTTTSSTQTGTTTSNNKPSSNKDMNPRPPPTIDARSDVTPLPPISVDFESSGAGSCNALLSFVSSPGPTPGSATTTTTTLSLMSFSNNNNNNNSNSNNAITSTPSGTMMASSSVVLGQSTTSTASGGGYRGVDDTEPHLRRFKTTLCNAYASTGRCIAGARCTFAHGKNEIRTREINVQTVKHIRGGGGGGGSVNPNQYKVKLCRTFCQCQRCPYDPYCMFAHGWDELRSVEVNVAAKKALMDMMSV